MTAVKPPKPPSPYKVGQAVEVYLNRTWHDATYRRTDRKGYVWVRMMWLDWNADWVEMLDCFRPEEVRAP